MLVRLSSILYPVCIEYSLIVGSLFFKLLHRTGQHSENHNRFRASGPKGDLKINRNVIERMARNNSSADNMDSAYPSDVDVLLKASPELNNDVASNLKKSNQISIPDCKIHSSYRSLLGRKIYVMPKDVPEYANMIMPDFGPSTYDCHHSHKGLFLGLVQFIVACIGLALFLMYINDDPMLALHIYQYSKIIILSTSLMASLCALWKTNELSFRSIGTEENFEYNLLSIGLLGCLVYYLFVLVPALETTVQGHAPGELFSDIAELYVVKCTLEFIESITQFFLLVEVSRRGPHCRQQCTIKPGRSIIIFLLISNLTLWLLNTFEVRRADLNQTLHLNYYGALGWKVITCSLIPLIIFFRFHSTVCLADIWMRCYRFH